MKRCMGCMKEVEESNKKCPYCGYENGSKMTEHYYLPEGTELENRYIIGKVLGHGGFGITYIGFDKKLELRVAVKEYLPADISTRAEGESTVKSFSGDKYDAYVYGLGRFIDEARTLAKYNNHPSIVSVSDFFEQNNTAYLVMEYLDGITLSEYLKKSGGSISEKETLSIIRPIIDALKSVHIAGIVHRDISPDNIFITAQGQIKLLDFGAARHAMSEKSKSLSVVLKPGFAPPEQYYSRGKQGPWTDVYAIGATMHRMLTGENPPEAMERMVSDTLQGVSGVSGKVSSAITKAMMLSAESRYQSVDELLSVLDGSVYRDVPISVQNKTAQTKAQGRQSLEKKGNSTSDVAQTGLIVPVGLSAEHPFKKLLIFSAAMLAFGMFFTMIRVAEASVMIITYLILTLTTTYYIAMDFDSFIFKVGKKRLFIIYTILTVTLWVLVFVLDLWRHIFTGSMIYIIVSLHIGMMVFYYKNSKTMQARKIKECASLTIVFGIIALVTIMNILFLSWNESKIMLICISIPVSVWVIWRIAMRQYYANKTVKWWHWVIALSTYVLAVIYDF